MSSQKYSNRASNVTHFIRRFRDLTIFKGLGVCPVFNVQPCVKSSHAVFSQKYKLPFQGGEFKQSEIVMFCALN